MALSTRLFSQLDCSSLSTSTGFRYFSSFSVLCIASTSYWTSPGERPPTRRWWRPLCGSSRRLLSGQALPQTIQRGHYLWSPRGRGLNSSCKKILSFALLKILATDDGRWRVKSECGQEAEFDAVIVATTSFGTRACLKVVVTAPVPQILQLGGTVHERLQDQPQLLQKLEKVSFLMLSFFRYKSIHSILYNIYAH